MQKIATMSKFMELAQEDHARSAALRYEIIEIIDEIGSAPNLVARRVLRAKPQYDRYVHRPSGCQLIELEVADRIVQRTGRFN